MSCHKLFIGWWGWDNTIFWPNPVIRHGVTPETAGDPLMLGNTGWQHLKVAVVDILLKILSWPKLFSSTLKSLNVEKSTVDRQLLRSWRNSLIYWKFCFSPAIDSSKKNSSKLVRMGKSSWWDSCRWICATMDHIWSFLRFKFHPWSIVHPYKH